MSYGSVKNASGSFIKASLDSVTAAAASVKDMPDDFRVSITNAPGKDAYPIASFTWLLVPAEWADAGKQKPKEPQQCSRISESKIELAKSRQQKQRENQRGKLVAVGHGNARLSLDVRADLIRSQRPVRSLPGAASDCNQ